MNQLGLDDIRRVIREELDRHDKIQSQLFTIAEAGQRLKVSRQTIYRMINDGKLHFMKLNGRKRFKLADLDQLATGYHRP